MHAFCVLVILVFAASPQSASAQSAQIEAAYVVLGKDGAVARAIVTDKDCPHITLDGERRPMSVRALPDPAGNPGFPVLTCEAPIPPGTTSASIEERALPLPKAALNAIAVLGDTGCRLKGYKIDSPKDEDHADEAGKFQGCDDPAQWPFWQVSRTIAAAKPDLVIHVGDYFYRESPCPRREPTCKGSPYGKGWDSWKADFFGPAAPLFAAAPWIMTRGNHESCKRGGAGYFRFLDPALATDGKPPACIELIPHYTVTTGGKSFIVLDSTDADDNCRKKTCSPAYKAEFESMSPTPGTWLVSHRPVWGIQKKATLNDTLQHALKAWNGKLPPNITLALAGHLHLWEVLSFADGRSPQMVLGNGGTMLTRKIRKKLAGRKIGGTTVAYGRAEHHWGFTMLTPAADGTLTATLFDVDGKPHVTCTITPTTASCN